MRDLVIEDDGKTAGFFAQRLDGGWLCGGCGGKRRRRPTSGYLLRTSDDTLSAEDVVLGYKQLFAVEDAFRTLKNTLELRPVYHRKEERIRAHVLLSRLALLLMRVAELRTKKSWRRLRGVLHRIRLGSFEGPDGRLRQRTELTAGQEAIFKALGGCEPPRFFEIAPSAKKPPATHPNEQSA